MRAISRTDAFVRQLKRKDFWLELNPGLSIGESDHPWLLPTQLPEAAELETAIDHLRCEGYFQLDPVFDPLATSLLAMAVEQLYRNDLPPVFVFVYDEFWLLWKRLAPILEAVLGPGYWQLPCAWAWYLAADDAQATGWAPHRDNGIPTLLPDGMPKICSIWIPLTDATPLNGCMYALPAPYDPHYHTDLGYSEVSLMQMQDVRALPATAGSVLGWTQALLHWGARSSGRAAWPRISLSVEFQRGDVPPYYTPLIAPGRLPALGERLALVGRQILGYQKWQQFPQTVQDAARVFTKTHPLQSARQ